MIVAESKKLSHEDISAFLRKDPLFRTLTNEERDHLLMPSIAVFQFKKGQIIMDQNGCFMIGSYTVSEPTNPIIVNGTVVNAGGPTNTDGSIDITVTGGTAPYVYDWSNSATSQDISTLAPSVYWVEVTDANGCSASASFTVRWNVGVNEAQAAVTNLYPNPANNYITIEADAVMTSITFVNLVGQLVYTSAPQSMKSTIDLSNVANGIYFVQIVANGKTITKKVEVVK